MSTNAEPLVDETSQGSSSPGRFDHLPLGAGLVAAVVVGVAMAFSPVLAVAVATVLVVLLLVSGWRDALPVLSVALIYSNALVIVAQRGVVPSGIAVLLVGGLGLTVVRQMLLTRTVPSAPPGIVLVLLFAAAQCVDSMVSVSPAKAQSSFLASLTQGILLAVLIGYAVLETRTMWGIVNSLILVGAILGSMSAWQHFTGNYHFTFFGFAQISNAEVDAASASGGTIAQPRLDGMIGETNRYAQTLAVLLPLVVARIVYTRSTLLRLVLVAAGLLIGAGVVFTYSRGAVVAIVALLVTVVVMRWVRLSWFIGAMVAGLFVVSLTPGYADRLSTILTVSGATAQAGSSQAADNAVRGRTTEILAAIGVFADHPVFGVGSGVFPSVYVKYAAKVGIRPRLEERNAHNLYAGIAAETGLLGLIPFVLLLLRLLSGLLAASREWATVDRGRALLARGFFCAVLVYAYSGMFLHLSYVRYFWVLVGLAAAVARLPGARGRSWESLGLGGRRTRSDLDDDTGRARDAGDMQGARTTSGV